MSITNNHDQGVIRLPVVTDDSSNTDICLTVPVGNRPPIRYAEARRIGTCAFADRIATTSIHHYQKYIDESIRTKQLPQTCIATIIAAFHVNDVSQSSLSSNVVHPTAPPILDIKVLAMGVGTKFLSEQNLESERVETESAVSSTTTTTAQYYGVRIRDCHAEVLCRRAFRKYLFDCIERLELIHAHTASTSDDRCMTVNHNTTDDNRTNIPILERYAVPFAKNKNSTTGITGPQSSQKYRLRSDVTLHMYCSSTPCGNSTIKKFATLQKETYCTALSNDTWPSNEQHHLNVPIICHSVPLGQFALLVKKDNQPTTTTTSSSTSSSTMTTETSFDHVRVLSKKERTWPIYSTKDWCPPGTTTVWSNQGSIHTCSDKIARWNYLGYQGSLLSSYIQEPIYITTMTVGRKFSSMTCRRAICCRLMIQPKNTTNTKKRVTIDGACHETIPTNIETKTERSDHCATAYQLHHPTVMGTGVYMDDTGIIEMPTLAQQLDYNVFNNTVYDKSEHSNKRKSDETSKSSGEVRFHSSMSFATWLQQPSSSLLLSSTGNTISDANYEVECIDGSTGYLFNHATNTYNQRSKISTFTLMRHFLKLESFRLGTEAPIENILPANTLKEYRQLKQMIAAPYEQAKDNLLTKHPVLRDWKRRYSERNVDKEENIN